MHQIKFHRTFLSFNAVQYSRKCVTLFSTVLIPPKIVASIPDTKSYQNEGISQYIISITLDKRLWPKLLLNRRSHRARDAREGKRAEVQYNSHTSGYEQTRVARKNFKTVPVLA